MRSPGLFLFLRDFGSEYEDSLVAPDDLCSFLPSESFANGRCSLDAALDALASMSKQVQTEKSDIIK